MKKKKKTGNLKKKSCLYSINNYLQWIIIKTFLVGRRLFLGGGFV